PGRRATVEPGRDSARGDFGVAAREVDARVIAPALGPGRRVEGDDAVEGGAQVEGAVDQDRRRLEGRLARGRPFDLRLAGVKGPGGFEMLDVLAVDPRGRREARPPRNTAANGPPHRRWLLAPL